MPSSISIRKDKVGYIAHYKTMDIVSQGDTKEEAKLNLLDCLMLHIDHAVRNENINSLFREIMK